ncbi:MAG: mechanosensitive ion channel family protein [Candidatus Aenigmatarchaeota archaeon]
MSVITELVSSQVILLGYTISISLVLWVLAVIAGGWIVNKISNIFIERAIKRQNGSEHAAKTSKKFSAYLIYSATFIVLLGVFGVPLSALGAAVGLIGLGLSFALKDILANFISGIFILVNRPFKIGDQIEINGEEGTVRDIRVRATDIRTYDGRKLIVPNSTLYTNTVVNNTAYDQRRFAIMVGIGYEDDIETAKQLAFETLEEAETVADTPGPQVLVDELGGSSVNLKLRGWTDPSRADMVNATSEVTQLIKEKYDAEGIDIPYPIQTVYLEE